MIPQTITTRGGLQVTVTFARTAFRGRGVGRTATDANEAAQLQAARLLTFLKNDDHFYHPGSEPVGTAPKVKAGWHEVDSTSLRAVKWDPDRESLTVEFLSNRARYRYDKVPELIVGSLLNAASHGQYFDRNIKGRYASTRLDE